ncbi:hypothetical protein PIB30_002179 [Stylosanthes scabra]|uniref:G domain-containing protein n=1 Tax=Stylosanthes scabra TaxID=79078 RepID=A0ABU6S2T6_9FABA|nr:hypothetical protein [Stylosanthes scabra]
MESCTMSLYSMDDIHVWYVEDYSETKWTLNHFIEMKNQSLNEVGTKVAAVSRKTNTTTHEVAGVLIRGDTQIVSSLPVVKGICFFDTPGLMLNCGGFPYRDVKVQVESAWSSVNLYEVLIVIFDVHRPGLIQE